jgi:hypothetical protein
MQRQQQRATRVKPPRNSFLWLADRACPAHEQEDLAVTEDESSVDDGVCIATERIKGYVVTTFAWMWFFFLE